jgi:SNF2 family DNA or RNA helicase
MTHINDYSDIELNILSPKCNQPHKIKNALKPHQLACLYKAIKMENSETIYYKIDHQMYCNFYRETCNRFFPIQNTYDINISTNIGIIGDIVGYGKTLTALSIIAQNPLENIHVNKIKTYSHHSAKGNSYFTAVSSNPQVHFLNNMISSTLIIVPRGPVYVQWEKTLRESTELKYLAIDNMNFIKKNLPEYDKNNVNNIINFFNQFDVVLIKNTTLESLFEYYNFYFDKNSSFINKWKRVMVDECHDILNRIEHMHYLFLWLISGTFPMLCMRSSSSPNSLYYNIKDILKENYINYMLVKCKKEFVRDSFKIPPMIEKFYLCKMSKHLQIIKNYISPSILEKINANDISGAIKDLGGKNETEEGIVNLICLDMNKDISNKMKEREYVQTLDISPEVKALKIKNIDQELTILNNKLNDLKARITEINNKTCSICLDNITNPIILECTHIFCGTCLMNMLRNSEKNFIKKCPECRFVITSTQELTAIVSKENLEINPILETKDKLGKGVLNKEESLLYIINSKKNGKFIVFSRIDNGFIKIIEMLSKNDISYGELKGNTNHMVNILNNFKNGNIKVILLNTQYAGSGIDISYATDVVIFHSMDVDKQQAIGRAHRVGRNDSLYVHNLCYEHEMSV